MKKAFNQMYTEEMIKEIESFLKKEALDNYIGHKTIIIEVIPN